MTMKIYAIYKGEENLFDGTARECAEKLGVSINTIHFWNTKAYKKRIESLRKSGKARNCKIAIVIKEKKDAD